MEGREAVGGRAAEGGGPYMMPVYPVGAAPLGGPFPVTDPSVWAARPPPPAISPYHPYSCVHVSPQSRETT